MGIKSFLFILLVITVAFYFVPVKNFENNISGKDYPLVVFENPVMYTMNEKSINRIVIAKSAVKYDNRDEIYDADITLKNQDITKNYNGEKLKADFVVKKADIYTLTNNVEYKRDNFIELSTDELIYDDKKKIAQNNKPFEAMYNSHHFLGKNLYLDMINDNIKSTHAHFEIDMKKI